MKTTILVLVVIAFLGGILYFADKHDKAQAAAYAAYEDCVQKQYGMLPSTYYAINGTTPTCQ